MTRLGPELPYWRQSTAVALLRSQLSRRRLVFWWRGWLGSEAKELGPGDTRDARLCSQGVRESARGYGRDSAASTTSIQLTDEAGGPDLWGQAAEAPARFAVDSPAHVRGWHGGPTCRRRAPELGHAHWHLVSRPKVGLVGPREQFCYILFFLLFSALFIHHFKFEFGHELHP